MANQNSGGGKGVPDKGAGKPMEKPMQGGKDAGGGKQGAGKDVGKPGAPPPKGK